MHSRRGHICLAVGALYLVLLQPACAQEINWRKDYGAALQEARNKKLPLLLDFRTETCYWCDKLESITFRDPAVVEVLNRQFIPLRLDGVRYAELVDLLKVEAYPTLLIATPGWKILDRHSGFLEASPFLAFLRRSLMPPGAAAAGPTRPGIPTATVTGTGPAWMVEHYQKAATAIGRSEYSQAVPLLRLILKEEQGYSVQTRAARLLRELETQAAARLKQVKELEASGRLMEAIQADQEMVRLYDGTQAAAEGLAMLSSLSSRLDQRSRERLRQSHELMLQAQEDFRSGQYLICLIRCDTLTSRFGDLPDGAEAAELAAKITTNPEWMQQVCDTLPDLGGMSFLKMAEAKLKQGEPQQAVIFLERVLQAFPNTRHAEQAQIRLSQIQGPPPLPVSEEKRN
jgi:tetratricopeptide (TPR) repeat protein